MKKLFALLLALVMVLSLAACGGGDDDKTPSSDDKTPSSSQQQQNTPASSTDKPDNTPTPDEGGSRADWDYADYADYTNGVPEPEFDYTVSGIINDQFSFKSKAPVDEINAWKQTLLDNGAEEVREGETWAVIDGAHLIEMNGVLNGEARIYISLDDRPVSGGEQPQQSDTPDPGTSGSTAVLHELFDIEQLAGISEFPDYAKKAIGDLRWCDDLGSDSFGKYNYNAYMKEVTQEDFETYIANLTANAPTNSEEGNIFGFYWDWGQITGEYFPDSGTLDVVLTAQ